MTKKLEEEFNLPPIEEAKKSDKKFDMPDHDDVVYENNQITEIDVAEVETALSTAEKIDPLRNVQGVEDPDVDMDDLVQQAVDS